MSEMIAYGSAMLFWLLSMGIGLTRPDSKWTWYFKGDAALCLLAALLLK